MSARNAGATKNMTNYDPAIHHRRSIRLKGYDYSRAGLYFVTICCQYRICRFGKIANGEVVLNDAGKMVDKWCLELSSKFADIAMDTYIIMPNHFHAIIVNTGFNTVGADLRVCPHCVCPHCVCPRVDDDVWGEHANHRGEHVGSPLHAVVQWFKTMTTNEYIRGVKTLGWQPFDKKLWQRNYWEHIIRNDQSYHQIADYIITNPVHWQNDQLYIE